MKMQHAQIERLVRQVFDRLKNKNIIEFKKSEKEVFERAVALVEGDFQQEENLVKEVQRMLDELERQNPGGFDRHKMFLLLKQKLAKQKGIIL